MNDELGLTDIFNSFSNPIAMKILHIHSESNEGFNLSDTANLIGEKISTVKDHLKKLLTRNLLYKIGNKYFLSNFGSFIYDSLIEIEILSKAMNIFGKIPSRLIPSKYLRKLLPFLKNSNISSNQWEFMTISNKLLNQIKSERGKIKIELKVLGWNSLALGREIIKNLFDDISLDNMTVRKLLADLNLKLISDKSIFQDLKTLKENELLKLLKIPGIKERFQVWDGDDSFSFTIMHYNNVIHFFLNEKDNTGLGPYFIIEDEPRAIKIFNKIFNYYSRSSKPLSFYL